MHNPQQNSRATLLNESESNLLDDNNTSDATDFPPRSNDKVIFHSVFYKSLPLTVDNLVVAFAGIAEAAIISYLGNDVVAATAYIGNTKQIVQALGTGLLYALQPLIAKESALEKHEEVGRIFRHSLGLGSLVSLPIVAVLPGVAPLLKALGQDPELADITAEYFYFYMWGFPAIMATQSVVQFLIATRHHNWLIPTSIFRTGVELTLSSLFIIALRWGVTGWGLATALQPWIFVSVALPVLSFTQRFSQFKIRDFRFNRRELNDVFAAFKKTSKAIFKVGGPVSLQMLAEVSTRWANSLIIGAQSVTALTAYQVASQWQYWFINPMFSLSSTASVLLAKAIGENRYHDLKRISMFPILSGVSLGLTVLPFFCTLQTPMSLVFLNKDDPNLSEILEYTHIILPLIGFNIVGFAFKYISMGALLGYKDTLAPMVIEFLTIILISISSSLLLSKVADLGAVGVVLGEVMGMFSSSLAMMARYFWRSNQFNKARGVNEGAFQGFWPTVSMGGVSNEDGLEQRRLLEQSAPLPSLNPSLTYS